MIILSVCSTLDRAQWPITLPRPIGIGWLYACPVKRSMRDRASICLRCPPGLCVDYRLMQPTAYRHRLSTESGPLGGKWTHNPEVRNLGPYHYASGYFNQFQSILQCGKVYKSVYTQAYKYLCDHQPIKGLLKEWEKKSSYVGGKTDDDYVKRTKKYLHELGPSQTIHYGEEHETTTLTTNRAPSKILALLWLLNYYIHDRKSYTNMIGPQGTSMCWRSIFLYVESPTKVGSFFMTFCIIFYAFV